MPSPRPSPHQRWRQWQHSRVSQQYLSPQGARHGYTLLKVPAPHREAFFDAATLLQVLGQVPGAEADTAVLAWRVWTRRLTAYVQRLARGQEGTLPDLPEALAALLDVLEEVAP